MFCTHVCVCTSFMCVCARPSCVCMCLWILLPYGESAELKEIYLIENASLDPRQGEWIPPQHDTESSAILLSGFEQRPKVVSPNEMIVFPPVFV